MTDQSLHKTNVQNSCTRIENKINEKNKKDDKPLYDPEELIPRVKVLGLAKDGFIMMCCLNATKERHSCVNAWCTNCSMALGGIKKTSAGGDKQKT